MTQFHFNFDPNAFNQFKTPRKPKMKPGKAHLTALVITLALAILIDYVTLAGLESAQSLDRYARGLSACRLWNQRFCAVRQVGADPEMLHFRGRIPVCRDAATDVFRQRAAQC